MTKSLLIFLFLISINFASYAEELTTTFDSAKANQEIENIQSQLPHYEKDFEAAKDASKTLLELRDNAQTCVEETDKKLAGYADELKQIKASAITDEITKEQQYLTTIINQLTNHRAECRVITFRSNDIAEKLNIIITELETKQRLEVTVSFSDIIKSIPTTLWNLDYYFSYEKFYQTVNINLNATTHQILFLLYIFASLGLFFLIRNILYKLVKKEARTTSERIQILIIKILRRYAHLIALSLPLFIFSFILFLKSDYDYLFIISSILLLTTFALISIRFILHPRYEIPELQFAPSSITRKLSLLLKILTWFLAISALVHVTFQNQDFPQTVFILSRNLFITILSILLIESIIIIDRGITIVTKYRHIKFIINGFLVAGLLTTLITEWMGYQHLTNYLIIAVSLTLLLAFITTVLHTTIHFLFHYIDSPTSRTSWQFRFRKSLGLKSTATFYELIWLKFATTVLLWSASLVLLLEIWGIPPISKENLYDAIVNGFSISGITINPLNLILAIYVYSFLAIGTRMLRAHIGERTSEHIERGAQNSLAAITGYLGFALSVIIALIIAGVNFAGIAIIAGALSVGIGFGLQNIVNNFVSGIVLLLERPIKIGDRIVVGQVEGHVTKINPRATVIRTRKRTEVIIPNSELITGQVDNLMYGDKQQRISLFVGVAYGSNTELVRDTLLALALEHPEVVNDQENRPMALFNQFGDSSLQFELRIVIQDVDRRQTVRSELNFAIDKAFREKKIEIAFPQMDLRIKEWPLKPQ